MPTHSAMSRTEREATLDGLDAQLLAIMQGQRKLRERLEAVPLGGAEAFDIRLLLVRLDMKADEIMRSREDFEDDSLPLQPPTGAMLATMRERIAAIRAMNVQNETARGIAHAVVAVAGQLPAGTTGGLGVGGGSG